MSTLPPGVVHDRPLVEVASGGADVRWQTYTKVKQYTNAFIKQDGKVGLRDLRLYDASSTFYHAQLLLGLKKRGIGEGLYVLPSPGHVIFGASDSQTITQVQRVRWQS